MALFALDAGTEATHFRVVEQIHELTRTPGSSLQISPGLSALHADKKIIFARPASALCVLVHPGKTIALTERNARFFTSVHKTCKGVQTSDNQTAFFDLDQLPDQLYLRPPSPGDYFHPFGMSGKKKVSRLLVDAKIPRLLRDEIPLLAGGNQILWVAGLRRSRIAPVTASTRRILKAVVQGGVLSVITQIEKRNS